MFPAVTRFSRRALALVLLGLAPCAAGAEAGTSTDGRWRVEAVAGFLDAGHRDVRGLTLGVRGGLRLGGRTHVRLGVSRFADETAATAALPPNGFPGLELELTTLEAGAEVDLRTGGRVSVGLVGSAVYVMGRASDAEEWDRVRRDSLGLRAAVTTRIRMGARTYLRPELGVRWTDRRYPNPAEVPPDVLPAVDDDAVDWELSIGVGWILGAAPRAGTQAMRHATE